jgi:hypothetical protein
MEPRQPVRTARLPHYLTPFIGRQQEVANIRRLLADRDVEQFRKPLNELFGTVDVISISRETARQRQGETTASHYLSRFL